MFSLVALISLVAGAAVGGVSFAFGKRKGKEQVDADTQRKYTELVNAVTDGKGLPEKVVEKVRYEYHYPEECGIGSCSGKRTKYCTSGSCAYHCQAYCRINCQDMC